VPELGSLGSVRGALSNGRSYRELIRICLSKTRVFEKVGHLGCVLTVLLPDASEDGCFRSITLAWNFVGSVYLNR
jgi:hypothetical protein